MQIKSIQLAFSVLYHYLDECVKKALSNLPIQRVDIPDSLLAQAESLVLGKLPSEKKERLATNIYI
ncbi:hypothetical protein [Basfia succiniciproducens]|uniref:hypothetical protein n=1 Tax=Basfia succiniciproducens TaxID=653940 RepID=UPI0008AC79A1|nr:hypothetical protein [Basfia succiniciproducens]SEQ89015.1 CRISPR-associated protein Csm1 [Basfia succiniciproducens]